MAISSRVRFFIKHLTVSVCIALLIVAVVFFIWYPTLLAKVEGVSNIFLMLLIIDVILGPLLGFLVYKEGKKSLKMDLSIIILIQILALSYGVYAIAKPRPAWIVQAGWLFEVVPANGIDSKDQLKAPAPYHSNSIFGPQWVAVNDSKNPNSFLATPHLMPSIYADMSYAKQRLKNYALQLKDLYTFNEKNNVDKTLDQYPQVKYWMPLRTSGKGLVVLLDQEYRVIQIVDLRPWEE